MWGGGRCSGVHGGQEVWYNCHGGLGGANRAFVRLKDLGGVVVEDEFLAVKLQRLRIVCLRGLTGCLGDGRHAIQLLQLCQPALEFGLTRRLESRALHGLDVDQHLFRALVAVGR